MAFCFDAPALSLNCTLFKPVWRCLAGDALMFEARPEAQRLAAKDPTSALNSSNIDQSNEL